MIAVAVTEKNRRPSVGPGVSPEGVLSLDGRRLNLLLFFSVFSVVNAFSWRSSRILARGAFPISPKGEKRETKWWVAYHVPILADLDGEGAPEVLLAGGPYLTAALRLDGEPVWHTDYVWGKPARPMQGVGDVDGDGRVEVGSCEPDRGFVCLDGATGQVRWTWPDLRANPASIVTCDVDGDGLEEFVLPSEKELIAFNGRGGAPTVIWRMPLPAACRQVVIADADGDGLAEILMPCADGYLYCVR